MSETKKRRKRGRDWHGWAFKGNAGTELAGLSFWWAEPEKPKNKKPTPEGRWVRVKFVEVK